MPILPKLFDCIFLTGKKPVNRYFWPMKYVFTALLCFVFKVSFSQAVDSSRTPYLMDKKLPFFKMMLTDSSLFYKSNLKKNRATIIIFFSPDCEHCQMETKELTASIKLFKKAQIIMASPLDYIILKKSYYSSLFFKQW